MNKAVLANPDSTALPFNPFAARADKSAGSHSEYFLKLLVDDSSVLRFFLKHVHSCGVHVLQAGGNGLNETEPIWSCATYREVKALD